PADILDRTDASRRHPAFSAAHDPAPGHGARPESGSADTPDDRRRPGRGKPAAGPAPPACGQGPVAIAGAPPDDVRRRPVAGRGPADESQPGPARPRCGWGPTPCRETPRPGREIR